jgi:hypothetical protein
MNEKFDSKADYKKYHARVLKYICSEYKDFHFNRMRNGSLLIQLDPLHKHEFHLLIGVMADPKNSISNIAGIVVNHMFKSLYGQFKFKEINK